MSNWKYQEIESGQVHKNNDGCSFLIERCISDREVYVKFTKTGSKVKTSYRTIRSGGTKDPMHPSVYGVGFIGIGEHKARVNNSKTREYIAWHSMMTRCYSEKAKLTMPSYKGCSVCHEWHNFQEFAKWYSCEKPSAGIVFDLDKDIIKEGNKVYCPEFCMLVPDKVNALHRNNALGRILNIKSPEGVVYRVENVSDFCREMGKHRWFLKDLASGKRNNVSGWTLV